MVFHINEACWHHYDQAVLQDLMEQHPFLFPHFRRQEKVIPYYELNQKKDAPYKDPWGCVWETTDDGITGSVHQHPLADWDRFDDYKLPDQMDEAQAGHDELSRRPGNAGWSHALAGELSEVHQTDLPTTNETGPRSGLHRAYALGWRHPRAC